MKDQQDIQAQSSLDMEFNDFLDGLSDFGAGEWVTVYGGEDNDDNRTGFYAALISEKHMEKALDDPSWDLLIGDGFPGFAFTFKDVEEGKYYRHSEDGVEPLLVKRSFDGMKEGYWEVSEEFRYYHNLYEDRSNSRFTLIDDNGDEQPAILLSSNKIKIKRSLLKEYLAVKKMWLALFFSLDRFSDKTVSDLGIKEHHEHKKGKDFVYSVGIRNSDAFSDKGKKSQAFLMGKKLIPPQKNFKLTLFEKNKKYVDFIIGTDKEGQEIVNTCEDKKLANFYGMNPGQPNYVTPVSFRREVLVKYYSQPDKYSVEDGHLACGGVWDLRMDNNHDEYVVVFLGDLGHLPYKEQLYWCSYNVAGDGKISHTAWERGFEVKFTDPEQADLFFKQRFASFQEKWIEKFGWPLFLSLDEDDQHCFKTLHVPLTNEQKEFDEQVLALTKILIDSLNEKKLDEGLNLGEGKKGIDKLENFLVARSFNSPPMIKFLRNLQDLRSTGVAHRKGKKYTEVKKFFGIGEKDLGKVFNDIMVDAIKTLNTLKI